MNARVETAGLRLAAIPTKRWMIWTGRVLSALPVLALVASSIMKLTHQPQVLEGFTHFGYPLAALSAIGAIELIAAVLYAIPRTTVFGAALATAYLGGAVATHVRIGEGFAAPIVLGVLLWVGLALRDEKFRALVLRR